MPKPNQNNNKTKPVNGDSLSYDSCNFHVIETGEGFLKAKVTATYPGVLQYWTPNGIVKKAKLPEDVLSEMTLDSLRGIPVTFEHPIKDGRPVLVTPENHSQYVKGSFSEPQIIDNKIVGLMTVYDHDAIEKIKSGVMGVSIGYTRDEVAKSGDYSGESYDLYQTNIRGNHLAITATPRAEMAGINFDSKYIDKISQEAHMPKYVIQDKDGNIVEGKMLSFRTLDGTDVSIDSKIMDEIDAVKKASKDELNSLKADIDSKKNELENLKKGNSNEEIDALNADIDSKKNEIEGLKKQLSDKNAEFDSAINAAVESRIKLHEQASALDVEIDGKSEKEIKLSVISKYMPEAKPADAEIDAFYSAALAIVEKDKKQDEITVDSTSIESMRAQYTENSQKISQE